MKKKLVLLFMMMFTVLGVVSCGNNDPYASMTISRVGGNDTPIQLTLDKEDNVFKSNEETFKIKVDAGKDITDLGVSVGSGKGFVGTSAEYIGDGVTEITAYALSPSYTGPFSLDITTAVGNKSISIPFNIDVSLNSFEFIEDKLVAVKKGDSIDLTKLNEFISFTPDETTQRDLKFSLVHPIDGENNGENQPAYGFSYDYNKEDEQGNLTGEPIGAYAEIINNRILQTKTIFFDINGDSHNVTYPTTEVIDEGSIIEEKIILKAEYSRDVVDANGNTVQEKFEDYVYIKVLDDCTNIQMKMNKAEKTDATDSGYFEVPSVETGKYEYDVVLTTPILNDASKRYNYERTIGIDFGVEGDGIDKNDFEIVSIINGIEESDNIVSLSDKKCVTIFPSRDGNFVVTSTEAGTYSHTFVLRHKLYPDVIYHNIVVNFKVIELPRSMFVNGSEYSSGEYIVCDNYPNNGSAEFKIVLGDNEQQLSGVFKNTSFYVGLNSGVWFENDLVMTSRSFGEQVLTLAKKTQEGSLDDLITAFVNNSTFKLKHTLQDVNLGESSTIYVLIPYELTATSYLTDGTVVSYFKPQYVEFPIKLNFVKTLENFFTTEQDTIFLDTTDYSSSRVEICRLPSGMTANDVVKSVSYDESLITIFTEIDESTGEVVYFARANDRVRARTNVVFEAKNNGLVEDIDIELYMSSFYTGKDYPLDVEITSSSSSYLHYLNSPSVTRGESNEITGLANSNPNQLVETDEEINYESVSVIFMHTNTSLNIGIYDYVKGDKYSIIKNCNVSYNSSYLAYTTVDTIGTISTRSQATASGTPTNITISYEIFKEGTGGVETETVTHIISIFILNNLRNLTTSSQPNNLLYVDGFLGYYDRGKASQIDVDTNFDGLINIGNEWNTADSIWDSLKEFVGIGYETNLENPIVDNNGNQITIRGERSSEEYPLYYKDLFEIVDSSWPITIQCKVTGTEASSYENYATGEGLANFLKWQFFSNTSRSLAIKNVLDNYNVALQVELVAHQFNYERLFASRSFTASMPNVNTGFELSVKEDGVYSEVSSNSSIKVYYTLNNVDATNKELIILENGETAEYRTRIVQTNYGNAGYIEIIPKEIDGEYAPCNYNIKITTKDNVENFSEGQYVFISNNSSTVKTFRVKFADGSESYPFEISGVDDFKNMIDKTNSGEYYHYVLTQDLDLISYTDFTPINLTSGTSNTFSLSGKHTFIYNGYYYERYSSIYNLRIYKDLADIPNTNVDWRNLSEDHKSRINELFNCNWDNLDEEKKSNIRTAYQEIINDEFNKWTHNEVVNIGLFGAIDSDNKVYISDLSIRDVRITIIDSSNEFDRQLNVGILAGLTDGNIIAVSSISGVIAYDASDNVNITNCAVSGNISIDVFNTDKNNNIGGMIGSAIQTSITGRPSGYVESISSTGDNANVSITISGYNEVSSVGGMVGSLSSNSTINDGQVVSLIALSESVAGNVGGVVGSVAGSTIENIEVSPKININTDISDSSVNVGSIAGYSNGGTISHSKVYFVNIGEGYDADEKFNIYVVASNIASVGGIVGYSEESNISYTYVRSFYNNLEFDDEYLGNIYVSGLYGSAVGGLIGKIDKNVNISYSYYDGDILVSNSKTVVDESEEFNVKAGLLAGEIVDTTLTMSNCYAVGLLYRGDDSSNLQIARPVYDAEAGANTFPENTSAFGVTFKDGDITNGYYYTLANCTITDTYAVINQNVAFITKNGESNKIYAYYEEDKAFSQTSVVNFALSVKNAFLIAGFDLVDGSAEGVENKWFYNTSYPVNTIEFGGQVDPLPILIDDNGNAMYDLVPTGIGVRIKENTKYDIPQDVVVDGETVHKTQLLMFLNENPCYEIRYSNDSGTISVLYNDTPITTTYVTIPLNTKIEFEIKAGESKDIIKIVGNKIYAKNKGKTTLVVRSAVDKTIATEITFLVVNGVTNFTLEDANNRTYATTETNSNKIYVDELNTMYINPNSNAKEELKYVVKLVEGDITLNGVTFNVNDELLVDVNQLDIIGKGSIGSLVKLAITPCIILNDITYNSDYGTTLYPVTDLAKTYVFTTSGRAISMENDIDDAKISVSSSTNGKLTIVTTNVSGNTLNETLYFDFGGTKIEVENPQSGNNFGYELLSFYIDRLSFAENDGVYTVEIYYTISFNEGEYNTKAESYDLNNVSYEVKLTIGSNGALKNNMSLSIAPSTLRNIFVDYYPRTSLSNNQYTIDESTNASKAIIFGQNGIMKITPDEKLNDSSYIVVLLPESVQGFIKIDQMIGVPTGEILDTFKVQGSNYDYEYSNGSNKYFGIRLRKVSQENSGNTYFNDAYYVKFTLYKKLTNIEDIEVLVQSFRVGEDTPHVSKTALLSVAMLPEVSVSIDTQLDSEKAVIGKGTKKLLKIEPKYTTNDITYSIATTFSDNNGLIYIAKEVDGSLQNQGGVLDINDFFDENGNSRSDVKFYLCVDVSATVNDAFTITFNVNEVVLGVIEEEKTTLSLRVVEYEISAIKFEGASANETYSIGDTSSATPTFIINHGESASLGVEILYRDIEIGDTSAIDAYKAELDAKFLNTKTLTYKQLLELQLSSSTISGTDGNIVDESLYGTSKIFYQYYYYNSTTGQVTYPQLEYNTVANGVKIQNSQSDKEDGYTYVNQYFVGMLVSKDNKFRLSFSYNYDTNDGKLKLATSDSDSYLIEIDILITIKDNSTYDHPIPIENAEQFLNACNYEEGTGEFILLNDITLQDWKPIDAKFKSLDGNGYRIIIESFNLDDFRGTTTANVGIFSTISANTLLKNVTIDISNLLVSETTFRNNLNKLMNSTSEDTFIHGQANIDLSYIPTVNFGVLAGTNYGTITNAKIISLNESKDNIYLHVLTNQQDKNSVSYKSNIGALVGVNSTDSSSTISGAITNSYAGISKTGYLRYANITTGNENTELENKNDEVGTITTNPFTIVGGNNLAGLVAINDAIIANSYTKALGLYNTYTIHENNMTAGFVGENSSSGIITNSFTEGQDFSNYRAIADNYMIESQGDVGGFVFTNAGTISNTYSNVYIENRTALSGAFVFENSGTIENSYTTGTTHTKESYGDFTGYVEHKLQNTGTYTNCYYLVLDGESINSLEDANALQDYKQTGSDVSTFKQAGNWQGFVFASADSHNGVWTLSERDLPELKFSDNETFSFRHLDSISDGAGNTGEVYNYKYVGVYTLGSVSNPLVLDTAENFSKYILGVANVIDNEFVIGRGYHIRLVNNLDFSGMFTTDIFVENDGKNYYLHNLKFKGIFEGNGMTLQNMQIKGTDKDVNLDNFGLFSSIDGGVIKNLNITLNSYATPSAKSVGVLAGEIINDSVIANVTINGNNNVSSGQNTIVVRGNNLSGGVAGMIAGSKLYYVSVSNVALESGYTSIDDSINVLAGHNDTFKTFTIYNEDGTIISQDNTFTSRKDSSDISTVSYSGGIAGIVEGGTLENITVHDSFYISQADMSGGIVGYLGEDSKLANAEFEMADDSQLIKGICYAGGLVGENYGTIERSSIEHYVELQDEIDASIVKNERESGVNTLFSLLSTFNVAIGGIAGYSAGAITDCYSKANVINSNSYIAGGLVGYGDIGNRITLSYSTGIVYSNEVLGGIIGFQNTGEDGISGDDFKLNRVVALTDWNAQGNDDEDEINYRQEITTRLYNNISGYYLVNSSYNKFFIKMPEIGNLTTTLNDSVDTTKVNTTYQYELDHDKYYVGSAIGKMYVKDKKFIGVSDVDSISDCIDNTVFSNTLGLYSTSGSVENGNRKDNFTSSSFSLDVGYTKQSIYSYRIAYNPAVEIAGKAISNINHYVDKSGYYDCFTYPQVFTAQEYTQQLIGSYADVLTIEGDKLVRFTSNVFDSIYSGDERFNSVDGNDSNPTFVSDKLTNWIMNDYLPGFRVKRENLYNIENLDQFIEAIKTNSADAMYILKNSITIDVENDIDGGNNKIWNNKEIKFSLMGVVTDGQTITFNVTDASAISTIFQGFDGASWSNLNIVVNYNNTPTTNYNTDAGSVALFANELRNSAFINCNITINASKIDASNPYTIDGFENGVTAGAVFGVTTNSTISKVDFRLGVSNVKINSDKVSFGYIVGGASITTVSNVTLSHTNENVYITANATNYSVGAFGYLKGGVVSSMIYAHIETDADGNDTYSVAAQYVTDTYSINDTHEIKVAVITGNTIAASYENISNYMALQFVDEDTVNSDKDIYIGLIAGNAGSKGTNNGGIIKNVVNEIGTSLEVKVGVAGTVAVGGLVGHSYSNNIYSSGNYAPISLTSEAENVYAGGVLGYSVKSLESNIVYSFANIEITNSSDNICVGGILGKASNQLSVTNVVVAGTLTITVTDGGAKKSKIGGIVGSRSYGMKLENFAILCDFAALSCDYVGGITYNGNAKDEIRNGYVYSETHKLTGSNARAVIGYNNGGMQIENVYYAQEFASVNYKDHDSHFATFAMADLYSDSTYSSLLNLSGMNQVKGLWRFEGEKGKDYGAQLLIPSEICELLKLKDFFISDDENYKVNDNNNDIKSYFLDKDNGLFASSKFNLTKLTGSQIAQNDTNYYVVLEDMTMPNGSELSSIISGRTLDEVDGFKPTISISTDDGGNTHNKYFFNENTGVISNLYFSTMYASNAQYLGLCNNNSGLIIGVMVQGETKLRSGNDVSAFVTTNSATGRIYKCVSSYIAVNQPETMSSDINIYSFAKTNNNSDGIVDVFSETFGYNSNYVTNNTKAMYNIKIANSNDGSRRFGGIPNEVANISNISNCTDTDNKSLDNIWNTTNSIPYIKGFKYNYIVKDNEGKSNYYIHTILTYDGSDVVNQVTLDGEDENEINVNDLKEYVRNDEYKTYAFGYYLTFYNSEELKYGCDGIVFIFNGNDLNSYLSANASKINSIVLLKSTSTMTLTNEVCANLIVSSKGAIISLGGIISVSGNYKGIIDDTDTYVIKENKGLIANLYFYMSGVNINDRTFIFDNSYGTIANVQFSDFTISFYSIQLGNVGECTDWAEAKFYHYVFVGPYSHYAGELMGCSIMNFSMSGRQVYNSRLVNIRPQGGNKLTKIPIEKDGNGYYINVDIQILPAYEAT